MTEEEAVFTLGKRFSELRTQGYDLSSDGVRVGASVVLPEELADEYDRHFPPGPRQHRQDTDRKFHYELVPLRSIWNGYVAFRRSQIHEMQEVLRQAGSPVKGDEVVLRKDHPDHRLQAGSIGTVDEVLDNDVYMIRFCGDTGLPLALKGNELLVTQYSEQWRWVRGIDSTTILKPG